MKKVFSCMIQIIFQQWTDVIKICLQEVGETRSNFFCFKVLAGQIEMNISPHPFHNQSINYFYFAIINFPLLTSTINDSSIMLKKQNKADFHLIRLLYSEDVKFCINLIFSNFKIFRKNRGTGQFHESYALIRDSDDGTFFLYIPSSM